MELTRDSVERKPSTQLLKKLIRLYLTPSLEHVVLEECHPKGNVAVTEATVDLLFTSCPLIESVTLVNCDMRKVSEITALQRNLLIRIPSGLAVLSFVERLSSFRGDFL